MVYVSTTGRRHLKTQTDGVTQWATSWDLRSDDETLRSAGNINKRTIGRVSNRQDFRRGDVRISSRAGLGLEWKVSFGLMTRY